jgi:hypothetical protein
MSRAHMTALRNYSVWVQDVTAIVVAYYVYTVLH